MKLRSSIFSSSTLSIESRIPAGATLAIILVVIANVWAYHAEKNGELYTSIPRQMIDNSIEKLKNNSTIWFLGNSTLAAGFDKNMLPDGIKNSSAIIKLGSATLETTVHLSEIALQNNGKKPEKILLFFTKDDLNQNGARAQASKAYHQAINSPSLYEKIASMVPVYSTRYAITDKLRNSLASIALVKKTKASNKKHRKDNLYKDLSKQIDTTYLLNLGRDYKPAYIDFSRIGKFAKNNNITIYLVAPPVTASISRWQAKYAPDYPWKSIMKNITHNAKNAGITVLDYTNTLKSTTEYFKDAYHLNSKGSKIFTEHLLSDINSLQQLSLPQ